MFMFIVSVFLLLLIHEQQIKLKSNKDYVDTFEYKIYSHVFILSDNIIFV